MTDAQIYGRLTAVLRAVFDDDNLVATPGLTADEVDDWDSLNHIRLMMSVQKAFAVNFSASEVGNLANIGGLVAVLKRKLV